MLFYERLSTWLVAWSVIVVGVTAVSALAEARFTTTETAVVASVPKLRLAQTSPAPQAAPPAQSASRAAAPAGKAPAKDSIGSVASVEGNATVTRGSATSALKVDDDIFKNDVLQTGRDGALGVTFDDETTFNLTANARLVVDDFVYQDGGKKNSALFNVTRGTAAFVANKVAKTGNMKIATPTATMGIRGTTGVVEVPDNVGAAGSTDEAKIKLYPDEDGRVGRIEVFNPAGARLGTLSNTQRAFAIRAGGPLRFMAVPFQISPQELARDGAFVRQVFAFHTLGRQKIFQRFQFRQMRMPGLGPNLQGPFRGPFQPQRQNRRERQQGPGLLPGLPGLR